MKNTAKARVLKRWPTAYARNASPGYWAIHTAKSGLSNQMLGSGETAVKAWKDAAQKYRL